jgi:two-component system, LytTR family, sensor kinase
VTWRLILLVYTVLGLLFAGQVLVDYAYAGHPLPWWRATTLALTEWYLWALVTPVIVGLARRFRFDRRRWPGALAVHVPVSLVCTVAKQIADRVAASAITGIARGPFSFIAINMSFLTYWLIVGAAYAAEHYQKYRERELHAARLEAALAQSELQSLRMQLHPHFLFNTLNTIAALMREDVEAADVMIARLGDLLRATLASADVPEVTLARELELVGMYLDIQRARMGDRLTARIDAAVDTLEAAVPTLLLQPIVENAIRHGAAARRGPARLDVSARRDGDVLVLEVSDDGPGPGAAALFGHGLQNTRARLAATHGAAASFELMPRAGGGALARIRMPMRPLPPESDG